MNILINEPLSVGLWRPNEELRELRPIYNIEWASEPQKHPFIFKKQKKNCDRRKWRIMVKNTENHVKYECEKKSLEESDVWFSV